MLSAAFLLALPLAAHAQSGDVVEKDEVVIEGIGLSRDVPCDGQSIGIYGADNSIHLTGDCADVVVHGDSHQVTIDQAKTLSITGADHTVNAESLAALSVDTSQSTVNATMNGHDSAAQVAVGGAEHTLNLTLASQTNIAVNGTEQVINWTLAENAPEPRIDVGGIDNAVNRVE